MDNKLQKFIEELKQLMVKHEVYLDNHDNYGGYDNYEGTAYYFCKDNDQVNISELVE